MNLPVVVLIAVGVIVVVLAIMNNLFHKQYAADIAQVRQSLAKLVQGQATQPPVVAARPPQIPVAPPVAPPAAPPVAPPVAPPAPPAADPVLEPVPVLTLPLPPAAPPAPPVSMYPAGTSMEAWLMALPYIDPMLPIVQAQQTSALTKEQYETLAGPFKPEYVNHAVTPQGQVLTLAGLDDGHMVVPPARAAEVAGRWAQQAFAFALNSDGICITYVPVADVPGITTPLPATNG